MIKLLWNDKDGGHESRVWAYGIEIKSLFSIILLRFENGSREAYHSHAFNCLNWVLKGQLHEDRSTNPREYSEIYNYFPKVKPFIIRRQYMHKVCSIGTTWVLSFRGPWANTWKEIAEGREITLTHGREEV